MTDIITRNRAVIALCLVTLATGIVRAQPQPGDIYKEFWWDSLAIVREQGKKWLTRRLSEYWSPQNYMMPYDVTVDDLDKAVRAELFVIRAQVLTKTRGFEVQINDGVWHEVGYPAAMVDASGGEPYLYESYTMMHVPIGLEELREGKNVTRMRVDTDSYTKAQHFIYGVVIRVYYDDDKAAPRATVSGVQENGTVGVMQPLSLAAQDPAAVRQVDYVGYYEEWNMQCDGEYTQWQYLFFCDEIRNHIGTSQSAPSFPVTWNTTWLPDQPAPMKVSARVVGTDGTMYMAPAVEGLQLSRSHHVTLVKPTSFPKNWNTAHHPDYYHEATVPASTNLSKADSVQVRFSSWGPSSAQWIGDRFPQYLQVNGDNVWALYGVGIAYIHWDDQFPDADLDIAMAAGACGLDIGTNTVSFTRGGHHGFCPCWPGLAFKIRTDYDASATLTSRTPPSRSAPTAPATMFWDLRGRRVPVGQVTAAGGAVVVSTQHGRRSLHVPGARPRE